MQVTQEWKVLVSAADGETKACRYTESERLWFAALEVAEEFDEKDCRLAFTLEGLAEVLWLNKNFTVAAPVCKRLMRIYSASSGSDHLDVGSIAQNLALIYHHWGNAAEAERYYKIAVHIFGLRLGSRNVRFTSLVESYTRLLSQNKRERDAHLLQCFVAQRAAGRWTKSGRWEAYNKQLSSYEVPAVANFTRVSAYEGPR